MPHEAAPPRTEAGRTDAAHVLRDRLPTAPPAYAEAALGNPALDEGILEVLLRNPGLPGALLARIAGDERFRRSDAIKRALVLHPATPWSASAPLVQFLHWRDLQQIGADGRYPSGLRAAAEKIVADRVCQLPAPEKLRLARGAPRPVVAALLRTRNPQVVQELLLNPRVVERDVAALASDPSTPPAILGIIARHGSWSRRPPVRMAVLENVSTPLADSFKLLPSLASTDLRALSRNVRIPAPLRAGAQKLLQSQRPGARAG